MFRIARRHMRVRLYSSSQRPIRNTLPASIGEAIEASIKKPFTPEEYLSRTRYLSDIVDEKLIVLRQIKRAEMRNLQDLHYLVKAEDSISILASTGQNVESLQRLQKRALEKITTQLATIRNTQEHFLDMLYEDKTPQGQDVLKAYRESWMKKSSIARQNAIIEIDHEIKRAETDLEMQIAALESRAQDLMGKDRWNKLKDGKKFSRRQHEAEVEDYPELDVDQPLTIERVIPPRTPRATQSARQGTAQSSDKKPLSLADMKAKLEAQLT